MNGSCDAVDPVTRILQQIQSELHHVRRSQDEAQSGGGTEPATRAGGDGAKGEAMMLLNQDVFSAGAWPLLGNLEDPELRRLAQSLPAMVLRGRHLSEELHLVLYLQHLSEEPHLVLYLQHLSGSQGWIQKFRKGHVEHGERKAITQQLPLDLQPSHATVLSDVYSRQNFHLPRNTTCPLVTSFLQPRNTTCPLVTSFLQPRNTPDHSVTSFPPAQEHHLTTHHLFSSSPGTPPAHSSPLSSSPGTPPDHSVTSFPPAQEHHLTTHHLFSSSPGTPPAHSSPLSSSPGTPPDHSVTSFLQPRNTTCPLVTSFLQPRNTPCPLVTSFLQPDFNINSILSYFHKDTM
eukprot:Em0012g83a